jgi:hypothetical protein
MPHAVTEAGPTTSRELDLKLLGTVVAQRKVELKGRTEAEAGA